MPFSTKQLVFGFSTALLALTACACGGNTELVVQPQTSDRDASADAAEGALPGHAHAPPAPSEPSHTLIVSPPATAPSGDPASPGPVIR